MASGGLTGVLPGTGGRRAVVRLLSPWRPTTRRWLPGPALLLLGMAVGGLAAASPMWTVAFCVVLVLVASVWAKPAVAAYLLTGLTPVLAGIDRGRVFPVLRPSEAIAFLLGMTLIARGIWRTRTRDTAVPRVGRVEVALLLLATTSSVVPLLSMALRQREITHDDLLYSLVLWKYLGLYAIVRVSVRTVEQVRVCLWLSVTAACVVAVIAILQALGLFGVPRLLATYYAQVDAPFNAAVPLGRGRGSSTLGLPAATGDLLIFNLAIAVALLTRERRRRLVLVAAATLLVVGVLSAAEFSTAIGLVIALVCIAAVTGRPRLLLYLLLAAGGGVWALAPVVSRRLNGFQSASGLPVSWTGRLHNLTTYFWPKLFSDWNVLFGVRPSSRVPLSTEITGYVWIESGYTWLLWGGGIPLLVSFLVFVHAAAGRGWRVGRNSQDAFGVAGIAVYVAVVVTAVLMLFDPHLTYRGSADALFFLLALSVPRQDARSAPPATTQSDQARKAGS